MNSTPAKIEPSARFFSKHWRVGLAVALLVLTVGVATAGATAPGRNGPIAFRRYLDDQQSWGAVFTMASNGTGVRQITRPRRGVVDDQPDWAPDGRTLAFTRCAPGSTCHIWTVAPDGSGLAPVGKLCPAGSHETTCPDDAHASFSRDSKHLAFVQATGRVKRVPITGGQIERASVAIMNRDGTGRHAIHHTKPFMADLDFPVFSPNGRLLVFEQHNSGLGKPADKRAVFVIGVDGSHLRQLTPWVENDGDNPDWSPDGKWILFHSHNDDGQQSQFFIIHPDGTGRKQLTHFANGTRVLSATFSPDGGSIVFAQGPEGGNIDVYTMRVDGTQPRRLTRSPLWDSAPDWGPA